MTKDDFAAKLAAKTGLSKHKARETIDCIFGTGPGHGIIATELDAGRDVTVTGFGRFGTRVRKARTGRNPQSGDPIWIPTQTVPTFKAGTGLKGRVADAPENGQPADAPQERSEATEARYTQGFLV